ncbi:MAG TPA: four helix bundle protein [Bacteroidia bacterium]|nr:four helix bundle protein [Bacteroidia bacterium]
MTVKTQRFEELIVWQKAHALVLEIYKLSKDFPKEETYGITSQVRRSSVSVAANISEGYRKKGKADKLRFLNIAEGSLDETKYYLILIRDLKFIKNEYDKLFELSEEVSKLLNAYSIAIRNSINK